MGFVLFLIVGVGVFFTGIYNWFKEKNNSKDVKAYMIISVIGICMTAVAFGIKFLS